MSTLQQVSLQNREPQMRKVPNANHRLDEHILRALNKIKKPGTAEEITELLNRDLGPGDQPFQVREVATWLRDAGKKRAQFVLAGKSPAKVTLLAILDILVLTSGVRIGVDAILVAERSVNSVHTAPCIVGIRGRYLILLMHRLFGGILLLQFDQVLGTVWFTCAASANCSRGMRLSFAAFASTKLASTDSCWPCTNPTSTHCFTICSNNSSNSFDS
jgi:hypothetical protein